MRSLKDQKSFSFRTFVIKQSIVYKRRAIHVDVLLEISAYQATNMGNIVAFLLRNACHRLLPACSVNNLTNVCNIYESQKLRREESFDMFHNRDGLR